MHDQYKMNEYKFKKKLFSNAFKNVYYIILKCILLYTIIY